MSRRAGRILVVDDNALNLALIARALEKAGYDVLQAATGEEGEQLAGERQPDLILLDVELPGKNGFEVCQALQSDGETSSIPIIFLTSHSDSTAIDRAFSLGGSDFIRKPFRLSEVKARVAVHCALRKTQKELLNQNSQLEHMSRLVADANCELARLARIDGLTHLLNRTAWEETVTSEGLRFARSGLSYSVLMLDVDHFKLYNDSLGHQAGDECLRRVAACLRDTCRATEIIGRYGGEEFVILAPGTSEHDAVIVGERLRDAVCAMALLHPTSPTASHVSMSIGVAEACSEGWEQTLRRADEALYMAKHYGRNRVCAASDLLPSRKPDTIAQSEEEGRPVRETPMPLQEGGGHRILIADDNAANRLICKRALERRGYEVLEAENGEQVVVMATEHQPHVILMDVVMPYMDGLTATRQLKADAATCDIPIIVVSAKAEAADIQAGLEAGADEYISKPVRTAELALRVKSMAEHQIARQNLILSNEARGEQARVLELLLELSKALGMCDRLDDALDLTVSVAADLTSCRRVSILLPDRDREYLRIGAAVGLEGAIIETARIPVGQSIAGEVFATGEGVLINSPDDLKEEVCQRYGSPFFASIPVVCTAIGVADKTLGVFNFTHRFGGRPFSPSELGYIDLIGQIAGTAIHSILNREARDEARDSILGAIALLAERRDSATGRHVERVTQYALVLAEELRTRGHYRNQIDEAFLLNLRSAAPIHDIGKVSVPDRILLKPDKLTPEERAIMQSHTIVGRDTIRSVRRRIPDVPMLELAEQIACSHHEWFDGSGYPEGRKGNDVPLAARIVTLADVYDAITTRRVYKEAMPHEEAEVIIRNSSGKQFDPVIVEAFVRRIDDFKRLSETLADHVEPPVSRIGSGV